tara:strand:- start:8705 stop:9010 length:306 start_codon:yes stop_codon:yes gene_type:complete
MNNDSSNTSQENSTKQQNEELGALWKRTSRNNMTYLAGHIKVTQPDGTEKTEKVVVFSNQHKKADNQPDYRVYISNSNPRQDSGVSQPSQQQTQVSDEELM